MEKNKKIKELFFNYPTKQWHFEQLLQEAALSRAQTNHWLKRLLKDNLIKRIKPRGRMPFYVANYSHPNYQNNKRLYALTLLQESGLLNYLSSIEKAEVIVLFGSFSRWDWYDESDIDIFIYGDADDTRVGKFIPKLKRDIQLFSSRNSHDLQKMGPALLKNIIRGITIKGIIPNEVVTYAVV